MARSTFNTAYLRDLVLETVSDILSIVASDMKAKKRIASGRTIREMQSEVDADGTTVHGVVTVPSWFPYVEAGSGPARRGTWFFRIIHQWAKDKHIISDDSRASHRISGAIAHHIITDGTRAHQIGGEDVFSTNVNQRLEKLQKEAAFAASIEINNLIDITLQDGR